MESFFMMIILHPKQGKKKYRHAILDQKTEFIIGPQKKEKHYLNHKKHGTEHGTRLTGKTSLPEYKSCSQERQQDLQNETSQ